MTSVKVHVSRAAFLLFILTLVSIQANPLLHYTRDSRPEKNEMNEHKKEPITDHYDQRQNGTENFRVKVDGLVFILAPADTLALAGAALEPNFTSLFWDNEEKPKPKPEKDMLFKLKLEKESIPKSSTHEHAHAAHKPGLRISHLIAPFLNKIRHAQQPEEGNLN